MNDNSIELLAAVIAAVVTGLIAILVAVLKGEYRSHEQYLEQRSQALFAMAGTMDNFLDAKRLIQQQAFEMTNEAIGERKKMPGHTQAVLWAIVCCYAVIAGWYAVSYWPLTTGQAGPLLVLVVVVVTVAIALWPHKDVVGGAQTRVSGVRRFFGARMWGRRQPRVVWTGPIDDTESLATLNQIMETVNPDAMANQLNQDGTNMDVVAKSNNQSIETNNQISGPLFEPMVENTQMETKWITPGNWD